MRVHVITQDTTSDQILARLVRDLIDLPDWTHGSDPNPGAELNLFFPYLWYNGFTDTPTAAWFTHLDNEWKDKADIWDSVARAVTLRLTSAQMYADALSAYGLTKLVTPPLDRKKFVVAPRTKKGVTRIGTSGMVYRNGRKGEALVARLAEAIPSATWVASGEGWPIPTTHYKWKLMQEFYQGLDLYFCSSLVEGIGYGPLEAMACGVPVVIPRGVGIFDSLPDVQNLFRYDAGDFDGALHAIELALAEPINRESLRGITARFTREAWRTDIVRAIEDLLYCARPIKALPEWAGHAGAFYVAYGKPARECAERAIHSWHTHMPGVPAVLVSDKPLTETIVISEAKTIYPVSAPVFSVVTNANTIIVETVQSNIFENKRLVSVPEIAGIEIEVSEEEILSYRFDSTVWNEQEATQWVKEHTVSFRPGNPDMVYVGEPNRPVTIAAVTIERSIPDVFIYNADEDIGARSVKTKIYDLAPADWQYVLYLDADTELTSEVGFLFDLLVDGWQLVFCTNPAQYVIAKEMHRPDNAQECKETFLGVGTNEFLQYNGGVFSFVRDEATKEFFGRWHKEWLRFGRRDQAALDRALYIKPLRVYTLSGIFNCITRYPDVDPKRAAILHYPMSARRWKGIVNGRLDSSEAWATVHPK